MAKRSKEERDEERKKELLAKEAKAIYRIRRIVLVNTEIIDEYIENFRDI